MIRRLLAALVAVGLIVGSVLLRRSLDSRSDGDTGGAPVSVICATELGPVCRRLETEGRIRVSATEDPATTAERLATRGANDSSADDSSTNDNGAVWFTTAMWADVVAARSAGADARAGEPGPVLAHSAVRLVTVEARAAALTAACGGTVGWVCLGDRAGSPWGAIGGDPGWGSLVIGHPSPRRGDGLAVLHAAVAARLGRSDYAANDLRDDQAFRDWFRRLERNVPAVPARYESPVDQMISVQGSYTIVGDLDTAAGRARAASARTPTRIDEPTPTVAAEVVLVPVSGGPNPSEVVRRIGDDRLDAALTAAGWATGGATDAARPRPGVAAALYDLWQEVTR